MTGLSALCDRPLECIVRERDDSHLDLFVEVVIARVAADRGFWQGVKATALVLTAVASESLKLLPVGACHRQLSGQTELTKRYPKLRQHRTTLFWCSSVGHYIQFVDRISRLPSTSKMVIKLT